MKEKIIVFIIGVLVGAVLATGAFFIYTKVSSSNNTTEQTQQINGERPEMNGEKPSGERPEMNGEAPPELPNGEKPSGERPDKSSNENTTENSTKKSDNTATENN